MVKRALIMAVAMVMTIGTIGCTKKKDSNLTDETKEETKDTYVVEDDVTEQESSSYDNETGNEGGLFDKIFGKDSTTEVTTEEIQTEPTTEKSQKKDGNDPSPSECKESYDKLYEKLEDKFGSPNTMATPENEGYTGVIWNDTSCGEIWLAWGDKIFGSEEADCILSFSLKGE